MDVLGTLEDKPHLKLTEEQEVDLRKRGLSKAQIHSCDFRGWPAGNMVVPTISGGSLDDLSTLAVRARSFYVQAGLVIPARNPEGLITALHLKPDDDKKNKYVMVSKDNSLKLLGGEDPLFCCIPRAFRCRGTSVPATSVLLIEGGLKAHTFALMLDHSPVIGAVGGSFYQSPNMLREYLVGLLADNCVLVPDAGATMNADVVLSYMRLFKLLEVWGIPARVLWWGQYSKENDLDGDDLLALQSDSKSRATLDVMPDFEKVTVSHFFWKLCTKEVQEQMLNGHKEAKTGKSKVKYNKALPEYILEEHRQTQPVPMQLPGRDGGSDDDED